MDKVVDVVDMFFRHDGFINAKFEFECKHFLESKLNLVTEMVLSGAMEKYWNDRKDDDEL